jgi:hypothetical protein
MVAGYLRRSARYRAAYNRSCRDMVCLCNSSQNSAGQGKHSKASAAFIDLRYYDRDGTEHQPSGGAVVVATVDNAQTHMRGERDPDSGELFSYDF